MWRELVQARDATANFSQGVTVPAIAQAEQSLHLTLPADLRTLLLETDGISGEYGPHYVWSLATIVRENLAIYQTELDWFHAMPLDHLLFFCECRSRWDLVCFSYLAARHPFTSASLCVVST